MFDTGEFIKHSFSLEVHSFPLNHAEQSSPSSLLTKLLCLKNFTGLSYLYYHIPTSSPAQRHFFCYNLPPFSGFHFFIPSSSFARIFLLPFNFVRSQVMASPRYSRENTDLTLLLADLPTAIVLLSRMSYFSFTCSDFFLSEVYCHQLSDACITSIRIKQAERLFTVLVCLPSLGKTKVSNRPDSLRDELDKSTYQV